jgi:hypothetical protein
MFDCSGIKIKMELEYYINIKARFTPTERIVIFKNFQQVTKKCYKILKNIV